MPSIAIGEIDAIEAIFSSDKSGADDARYILQPKASIEDYLATMQRFPQHSIKRTSEYYIDDPTGAWFMFANVDCYDPPVAIIRARSFESAYVIFCDEWEQWIAVGDVDAVDYPEDTRQYNNNGTHIDTENIQGHALTLLTVRVGRLED